MENVFCKCSTACELGRSRPRPLHGHASKSNFGAKSYLEGNITMRKIYKVCPCIVRRLPGGYQILCFWHPLGGKQIPKGTVEEGEEIDVAALRELKEESGIKGVKIKSKVGIINRYIGARPRENGPLEHHEWHVFLIDATEDLSETWQHEAVGSEDEQGLIFSYFWQNMPDDYNGFHPKFVEVFKRVEEHLGLRQIS